MVLDDNQPDFEFLLTDGAVRTESSTRFTITRDDGPELVLPTGRLAASGFGTGEPFVETVPPGRYRTAIFTEGRTHFEDDGVTEMFEFDTVGALRITIQDSPVTRWEPALMTDEDPKYHNKSNTFAVDGGIGIISDATLGETFLGLQDVLEPFEPTKAASLLAGVVNTETGANALCIMYGGDGVHDSWIGRTADGSIACFVIV